MKVEVERPPRKDAERKIILKRSRLLPFKATLDYMASRLPGGKKAFMDLMRLACEIESGLAPIVQIWLDTQPRDRRNLSIDQMCESAPGISTARIAGLVMESAMTWGLNTGNMIAALNHPEVVEASVARALTASGVQDRRMQFLHSGFLKPEGATINVSSTAHSEAEAAAGTAVSIDAPGLPPFELETVERANLVRDIEGE